MFTRSRSARLCSLHSGSLHITSLVFLTDYYWDVLRPRLVAMLRRQRLLRSASHTMLHIMFVAVDRTHA
ncbi:MAG: hypothetical protein LUQ04_08065 [Methanoregula sp.]|nr:hypothetical protein [Methanoregula sp.]